MNLNKDIRSNKELLYLMNQNNEPNKEAVEWARNFIHTEAAKADPARKSAAEFILANAPNLSMDQTDWDDRVHHLAGADHLDGGERVMLYPDPANQNQVVCTDSICADDMLIPNGKRYQVLELTDDIHPRELLSPGDYDQAPKGTVVSANNTIYLFSGDGFWTNSRDDEIMNCLDMAEVGKSEVLVWGHEE
ncbi:hypothetical protein HMPREF2990_01575 [Corynebacterium sp. HMSC071B10]|nr:hypothetical protein HMPREF2990_01575 [Corynebacterium sp. HMSC071B10]